MQGVTKGTAQCYIVTNFFVTLNTLRRNREYLSDVGSSSIPLSSSAHPLTTAIRDESAPRFLHNSAVTKLP